MPAGLNKDGFFHEKVENPIKGYMDSVKENFDILYNALIQQKGQIKSLKEEIQKLQERLDKIESK